MNILLGMITDIVNTLIKRYHDKKMAKRLESDKRQHDKNMAERLERDMRRELDTAATVVKHDTDTARFNEELRTKVKETTHLDITKQGLEAIKHNADKLDEAGR